MPSVSLSSSTNHGHVHYKLDRESRAVFIGLQTDLQELRVRR
jgi:hypothetical protein